MEENKFTNKILNGNCLELCNQIPDNFVQTIVTSPPYFGLRKYGTSDYEIGRESTIDDYIDHLVMLFHGLRSKLKEGGSLWLNLGDSYINKELQGIPWRVALALKGDGWILRNDVIWHKPNAMPSSVKDRLTIDHEYLFFFTKSRSYYYNSDAIREPHVTFSSNSKMRGGRKHFQEGVTPEKGKNSGNANLHTGDWSHAFNPKGRNKRTVWSIPLSKFRDVHFAVFPKKLIEPCILATSQKGDLVLDPFIGSGTTAIVALEHERNFLGFELVNEYVEMANNRIEEWKRGQNLSLHFDE